MTLRKSCSEKGNRKSILNNMRFISSMNYSNKCWLSFYKRMKLKLKDGSIGMWIKQNKINHSDGGIE